MSNKTAEIENGVLKRFWSRKSHVVIPMGIRVIGQSAFFRNDMQNVTIPESVTEICDSAFMCCYHLKSAGIPDSVKKLGKTVFAHCFELETVTLPPGIKVIGDRVFEKCRSLKSITLPEGLEEIGTGAFADCIHLESINIPGSLTKIGKEAFRNCTSLKLANVPECVPEIGENAFDGIAPCIPEAFFAARKRKIAIYSGCIVTVTNLRRHKNADRLQCTEINGHMVIVGDTCRIGQRLVYFPVGGQLDEEFARENHLKRRVAAVRIRDEVSEGLALPVEVLEKYTDIRSLKDGDRIFTLNGYQICCMYIPDEMDVDIREKTLLRYRGNKNSPQKVDIPWGIKHIGNGAFAHCRHIKRIVLPETVKTIETRAFYDCPDLKKIVIPDSVTRIGEEAFAHCGKLSEVRLPEKLKHSENDFFDVKDFLIENGRLIKFRGDISDVVIPEGITEIGNAAFCGSNVIESVLIPQGVTKIGEYAFEECKRLRKVSIPGSVKYIGYEAFYRCRSLHEVTVPPSVEFIGKHAFGEYFFFKYIEGFKFPYEEYRKYNDFRMYCEKGSTAEQYARENDLTYYTS